MMKQIKLYTFLILMGGGILSHAQGVNVDVIENVATEMAEKIQLDEAKKSALIAEMKSMISTVEEVQNSTTIKPEDKPFEVVKILKAGDEKIEAMLSPEEYAMYKQLQTELKSDRLKGANGDDKAQEVLNKLKQEMDISDEKAQLLGEILINHESEKRNIKAVNEGNVVAIRNQIKTLNQKTNLEVQTLLTESEYAEYLQLIIEVNQDR